MNPQVETPDLVPDNKRFRILVIDDEEANRQERRQSLPLFSAYGRFLRAGSGSQSFQK